MRSILTVFLGFYSFVQGNIHLSDGNCGSTFGKCASGYCCSRYGYCGTSLAYCGDGCQPQYGTCLSVPTFAPTISTNADGHCGSGFGSCSQGYCCSSSGYCGTSSAYCGTGCQAKYGSCSSVPSFRPTTSAQPVAPDGRCGAGIGSCLSSYCCSSYGYCGKTSAYCGSGCQLQYGVCTATASPIISPSVFPSALPTSSPISSITPTTTAVSSLPTTSSNILSSIASWTYYDAYPKCCPNEPNYDPNYPTTECVQYNGCAHPGDFAAIGQRSLSYTESNDLISFYDNSDPNGNNFYSKYGNKYISIIGECNGVSASFTALIADTCGNNDCGGCCALNANPITGYLIDMEYYTVMRHFGTTDCADAHHNLQFSIDLNQPPAIPNCGASYGPCHGPQQCCSSSDYCGFSSEYCGAGCQSAYGYCADVVGGCGPASGQVCSSGLCCSKYGYCGSGSAYCGSGCQVGYGNCQ